MTPRFKELTVDKCRCSKVRGQSVTEYLLLTAAIALVLGVGMVDESSALRQLLDAFSLAYRKISFAISLPI
ncbi:MAG: hypothetical protein RL295_1498 [Pseudomonadota bacterium]|jgi:hypothetical protein